MGFKYEENLRKGRVMFQYQKLTQLDAKNSIQA